MASTQTELHNRLAGEIVKSIVKPPLEAGGNFPDVLVLLESVVTGVVLACAYEGSEQVIADTVAQRVKERLAKISLAKAQPAGSA